MNKEIPNTKKQTIYNTLKQEFYFLSLEQSQLKKIIANIQVTNKRVVYLNLHQNKIKLSDIVKKLTKTKKEYGHANSPLWDGDYDRIYKRYNGDY